MSSVENLLRTVNEYMTDMYNTFGGQSVEYMSALKQYHDFIPENALETYARQGLNYDSDNPDAPLLLSRGKSAQTAFEALKTDLEALRAEQRKSGTALVQAQKYLNAPAIPEPDEKKPPKLLPRDRAYVRAFAQQNYILSKNLNDWYDIIMSSDVISDAEKIQTKAYYSEINAKYYDKPHMDQVQAYINKLLNKIEEANKAKAKKDAEQQDITTGISVDADILK